MSPTPKHSPSLSVPTHPGPVGGVLQGRGHLRETELMSARKLALSEPAFGAVAEPRHWAGWDWGVTGRGQGPVPLQIRWRARPWRTPPARNTFPTRTPGSAEPLGLPESTWLHQVYGELQSLPCHSHISLSLKTTLGPDCEVRAKQGRCPRD